MNKLNLDIIKLLVHNNKLRWTNHILVRLLQRNITQEDITHALLKGEIIEEYDSDYPYPSCLVCGLDINNKIIHIVCGSNGEELWLITAYYPNKNEWEDNFKIRKEKK